MPPRTPLSPRRILVAATDVADRDGLAKLSMRNVGKQLGVEAMSLYHHIPDKDALLDQLVDHILGQIELPGLRTPWRRAMVSRAESARAVLGAHPWAIGLVDSRSTPGPALLRHHDRVLGCLRANGFSIALAAHAFSAIDAYVYGFVMTQTQLPFEPGEDTERFAQSFAQALPAEDYPHLAELLTSHVLAQDYDYGEEFHYGLDLILHSLERQRRST